MYNKLDNRKNHVLLNILLCLPLLFCLSGDILSREKILISFIPFRKYLLYIITAFIPAHLFYKFLMPLHETGHYLIALFFKKKRHLDIDIWMDKKHTSCSSWRGYSGKEARFILCAGMLFKFIYCIGIIFIFAKMNINFGIIVFIYVIWFEIVLNALPILKESDGYKMIYTDLFYNEERKERNIKEELFVKRVYPWILLGITMISIGLFGIMDKVLIFLMEIL